MKGPSHWRVSIKTDTSKMCDCINRVIRSKDYRYKELVFHDLLPSFRILGRVREMLRVPNMLAGTSLADSPDDTEVIVERHSRHVVTIILLPGA